MLETKAQTCFEITNDYSDKKNIHYIPIDKIRPNPYQPRKNFNRAALQELAESIRQYGVLQPINVRKTGLGMYELVAGERRLRASQMAGLTKIPAVIVSVNENDSAIIALIENLQREDLSYLEEAESYYSLLKEHGLTQDELARKIGKSQSTVANKIRLLKLSPMVRKILSDNKLTERHARALLKLPDEQLQLKVLKIVCEKGYNVKKTEELVEKALNQQAEAFRKEKDGSQSSDNAALARQRHVRKIIKDIRIFVNTIKESIRIMKESGVVAKAAQFDRGEYYEFIVRIPKKENFISTI